MAQGFNTIARNADYYRYTNGSCASIAELYPEDLKE